VEGDTPSVATLFPEGPLPERTIVAIGRGPLGRRNSPQGLTGNNGRLSSRILKALRRTQQTVPAAGTVKVGLAFRALGKAHRKAQTSSDRLRDGTPSTGTQLPTTPGAIVGTAGIHGAGQARGTAVDKAGRHFLGRSARGALRDAQRAEGPLSAGNPHRPTLGRRCGERTSRISKKPPARMRFPPAPGVPEYERSAQKSVGRDIGEVRIARAKLSQNTRRKLRLLRAACQDRGWRLLACHPGALVRFAAPRKTGASRCMGALRVELGPTPGGERSREASIAICSPGRNANRCFRRADAPHGENTDPVTPTARNEARPSHGWEHGEGLWRRIFFSPDGRKMDRFGTRGNAEGRFRPEGGSPFHVCDAPFGRGAGLVRRRFLTRLSRNG